MTLQVEIGMAAPDWELRLGYLIHDVSRLRRTLFDKWLSPQGITRSQWWVLAFLSRNDGMPQTELALELDVGKVALGALIDRLEDGGFVKRKLDPSDRRVKRVVLTKQSMALIETVRETNAEFNQRILTGIPLDRIEATIETLRTMKHNLIEGAKEFPSENGEETTAKPPSNAAARSSRKKRISATSGT
jgi:MarR family transcriptional regulator, transcriptional regulator for hemolysin